MALLSGVVAFGVLHLALLLASEQFRTLRDPVYADKERKLARLERSLPPDRSLVLFLGTSRTANAFNAGLTQAVLSANFDKPVAAFNWGLPASGPIMHLLHLKRMLADGHRPTVLLLEILPATLAELPDGPMEARFTDGVGFEWSELPWLASYGFPTEKYREPKQRVLVAPWYGLRFQLMGRLAPTAIPYHLRCDWSRGPDRNGWSPVLVEQVDDARRAAGVERARLEYEHTLRDLQLGEGAVRALRDLLALCRENDIAVVLVRMPEANSFRALYPPAVDKRLTVFFRKLSKEFGCSIADCRTWMPDHAFADGHHLLRVGATGFTGRLTQSVVEPALRSATNRGQP